MYDKVKNRKCKKKTQKNKGPSFKMKLENHVLFSMSTASMHGLIHIVRNGRQLFERLMWFCLVVGASVAAILQAVQVWQHYQTRPVVISIEKDYFNWNTTFPSITICQKEKTSKSSKIMATLMETYNISWSDKVNFENYIDDLLFSNYHNYRELRDYATGVKKDYLPVDLFVDLAMDLSSKIVLDPVKSKIAKTTHPLSKTRPFYYILTEIGPCTIYNSEIAIHFDPTFYNQTNITNGYEQISISSKEAHVTFSSKNIFSNYDVYLHSPNEFIDVSSSHTQAYKFSFNEMEFNILSVLSSDELRPLTVEQRNCRFTDESQILKHSPVYGYTLCRMECRIRISLKYCNCTPYYYRRLSGEPICNMAGLYCLSKYSDLLISLVDSVTNKVICPCVQSCDFHNIVVMGADMKDWFLDTNIKVSLKEFPEYRFKRNLVFTKSDVLVQIGGLFGLFLGCSVLSLMEIPYFFMLRFFWGVFGNKPIKPDIN